MNLKTIKKQFARMRSSIKSILEHPLTQHDKMGALRRYFSFHILGRLVPDPILFPYIGNTKFLAQPGMAGIVGNIYMGLDDFEEQGFLLHFLRTSDLFVDVGANVGAYTLLASGVCLATSIAIEPIPDTFERLMSNIRVNNLTNLVQPRNIGVGAQRGEFLFTNNHDVMNKIVSENDGKTDLIHTTLVDVVSLDELLKEQFPLLIKIDVEGYEREVLAGSSQILQCPNLRAIIIELSALKDEHGVSYEQSHAVLVNHGFAPYAYDPFERVLSPLTQFNQHKFNTLYLRDVEWVAKRISEAPPIIVLGQSF